MTERPILFSAPMVRAILSGQKTQTRRAWREQPPAGVNVGWVPGQSTTPYGKAGDRLWVREAWCGSLGKVVMSSSPEVEVGSQRATVAYRATYQGDKAPLGKWRPSIHMPRWASRIDLEITSVRVERLQAISEADAWAEGCKRGTQDDVGGYFPAEEPLREGVFRGWDTACDWFADLWEEINGAESWDANPWVWVVEFKLVKP